MREELNHLKYGDELIPITCNINVLEIIQKKYGSFDKWSELIAPDYDEENNTLAEPDYAAIKFGYAAMINEGIDIENEMNGENKPFKTEKQVARIISHIGIETVSAQMAGEIEDFAPESDGDDITELNPDDEDDEELKN